MSGIREEASAYSEQYAILGGDWSPYWHDLIDLLSMESMYLKMYDSHHVLIAGTPETVRERTRDTLEIMMPGGGYVAGASHDTILEETPVENVVAMFDAVREFGVYR